MDPIIYQELHKAEDKHWWFVGRRRILTHVIKRLELPHDSLVMEAGCGSGGNLPMLAQVGAVRAFELYDEARENAIARNIGIVEKGELPHAIPFTELFDLIVMTDVLEHVEDDKTALEKLAERLKPEGVILLTVPAYPWLWSKHDELHHHKRRYTKTTLKHVLAEAGFETTTLSYFNFFLFPAVALIRIAERFLPKNSESYGGEMPPKAINAVLAKLFGFERFFVSRSAMPFGLSLIAVAKKKLS